MTKHCLNSSQTHFSNSKKAEMRNSPCTSDDNDDEFICRQRLNTSRIGCFCFGLWNDRFFFVRYTTRSLPRCLFLRPLIRIEFILFDKKFNSLTEKLKLMNNKYKSDKNEKVFIANLFLCADWNSMEIYLLLEQRRRLARDDRILFCTATR